MSEIIGVCPPLPGYLLSCGRCATGAIRRRAPKRRRIEYDTYGWSNFDSDADGVRRLDQQWVSAHALALVDAAGWKAAVDVWHKKVTPTSTNSREGASPSPVGAAQHSPEQA